MTQRSECVADWYKMAQTVFLQTQILDKDIDSYEHVLESFSYRLSQESKERNENFLHSLDRLPGKSKTVEKTNVPAQESTKKWRNICDAQEQITVLLYENGLLIDQLDHLSAIDRLEDAGNMGYEL
jgi:TANK-binding kinase 1